MASCADGSDENNSEASRALVGGRPQVTGQAVFFLSSLLGQPTGSPARPGMQFCILKAITVQQPGIEIRLSWGSMRDLNGLLSTEVKFACQVSSGQVRFGYETCYKRNLVGCGDSSAGKVPAVQTCIPESELPRTHIKIAGHGGSHL